MIIATAGHVDHGKSALLQALTGVDPMHLPEEKKRGMTIDIGFAFLPGKNHTRIAFVDVPGHEKFLSNMLAGVGGVQHALLVVACDDGIMPQTREHAAILKLLNITQITVALTKADRADEQRQQALRQEVADWLTALGFAEPPVLITSTHTGAGIDTLRQHLTALPDTLAEHALAQRFRLAIDRVFHVRGAGVVVTGTVLSGQVHIGDSLWLTGAEQSVRVRELHAQNQKVEQAQAGQRVALNIVGRFEKQDIARGDWLLVQQPLAPVSRVLAQVETAAGVRATFRHWHAVHAHHGAQHASGHLSQLQEKVQPGEIMLAEIVLDAPMHLAEDDRLILRDSGTQRIIAGARVLSLHPPRRGKRQPAFLDCLKKKALQGGDQAAFRLALQQGYVTLSEFAWARQLNQNGLQALLAASSDILVSGDFALAVKDAEQQRVRILETLATAHQQTPDQIGVGRARLHRMALPAIPEALVFAHLDQLLSEGKIVNSNGWLHLPEHSVALTEAEQALWQRVEPLFAEAPCWVRDLASELSISEEDMRAFLRKAARLGKVIAIVRDRYYLTEQVAALATLVREHGCDNAGALRDRLDIGRKLAIQILEFFDRSGFTRRQGDKHVLRDAELFKIAKQE
jgi:selenocysteine-specific elongation factor SelB